MDQISKKELIELTESSKRWSFEEWDSYLSSIDVSQREDTISMGHLIDVVSEESLENNQEKEKTYESKNIARVLKSVIRKLYPKEALVLRKIYWEDKKMSEVAKELNQNRSTISRTHQRAMRRVRKILGHSIQDNTKTTIKSQDNKNSISERGLKSSQNKRRNI